MYDLRLEGRNNGSVFNLSFQDFAPHPPQMKKIGQQNCFTGMTRDVQVFLTYWLLSFAKGDKRVWNEKKDDIFF